MGLIGCSTGSIEKKPSEQNSNVVEKTAAPQQLSVAESGYSVDADGFMTYAAVVENPNSNWLANYPKVTVTAKDANGAILFSHDDSITYLFPNGKQAITGFTSVDGSKVASVEATAYQSDKNWTEEDVQGADADSLFEVTNLNEMINEYGRISYTGEVSNKTDQDASAIKISVVLRNAAGAIVGGYYTYVNDVQPGGTSPFQMQATGTPPEHAGYEVYAYLAY